LALAFFQFTDWRWIAATAAVFLAGHLIEANFLSPKLIGDRVGLHPVWVIFALLAGGALLGFVGILLAVPVAASIGVLARFALKRYLASRLYSGADGDAPGG
jgi:predicted PurR-regulated permease PerM